MQLQLKAIPCYGNLESVTQRSERVQRAAYKKYPHIHMQLGGLLCDNSLIFELPCINI